MKVAWLICLGSLFSLASVAQSADKITSITLTKQSRGFLDEVIISRDSVQGFVDNHRMPDSTQQYASGIEQDDWSRLMLALQNISLSDIDGLQSPTQNRAHDGAIHSTILITFEDGSSVTHSFDDENPHPDLQPLLNEILRFRIHTGR